ncbi:hypothetical protein [Verrucomicrobium sp. BvORR106]|uniref:hypothetical protein n=1 Tax=Verrucomicrobium sp. BvORR106 TaxID=1403819 RepID=UPI00057094FC|nr:hypothetical protein [Verrucomicrobium sp. BvORR106]
MKPLAILALLVSTALGSAPILTLPTLKTAKGAEYSDVKVTEKLVDGVKIVHSAGVARISYKELPLEVQQALGGFDELEVKAAMADAEASKRERIATAKRQHADDRLDFHTWEPYSSEIAKLKQNVTDPERYEKLKSDLAIIQDTCRPLLESGVERSDIIFWVKATYEGKIAKGMPGALLLLAWGQPSSSSKNSSGVQHWHWRDAFVTVDSDGFVDYYSINR